jgi:hypothetical protein
LNSPQFVEAARTLATTLTQTHGTDDNALLTAAFRRLTSRHPDAEELVVLSGLFSEQVAHFTDHPDAALALIATGSSPAPETKEPARVAAATTIVSTLLNFDECISKR